MEGRGEEDGPVGGRVPTDWLIETLKNARRELRGSLASAGTDNNWEMEGKKSPRNMASHKKFKDALERKGRRLTKKGGA